jgi:hypothetical protein
MQHIPKGLQMRVRIGQLPHGGGTVEDCVACHLRAADNMLVRGVEILRLRANRKRRDCHAGSTCADTGLPMSDNEPPHTENCECFLARDLAYAVLDIGGQHEVFLERADRLAPMLDHYGGPQGL